MRIRSLTPVVLLALVALAAPAAHARPPVEASGDLWATVNVCDSAAMPNEIGIRASMPGLARRSRMQMRFRVQYLRDGTWRDVATGGDSGWTTVARARGGVYEAGRNFRFPAPQAGEGHTLRGRVTFRWRRAGRTLSRLSEITEAGHPGTRGSDPPGYSAATCEIT